LENESLIFPMKNRTLAGKLIEHTSATTPCFIIKSGDLFLHNSLLKCQSEVYLFIKAKIN
jgi:hypothetical protein